MTKSSILTRVLFVVIMLSSILSFADGGMRSTTHFLAYGKTGLNWTSSVAIPVNDHNNWLVANVTAIANATAIDQTSTAMNTNLTMRI